MNKFWNTWQGMLNKMCKLQFSKNIDDKPSASYTKFLFWLQNSEDVV